MFRCFLSSWILFPWSYFNNNCSISFFILFSAKYSLLFIINSILILINKFWSIQIKTKHFGISYYNHIFFHYSNDLIKLLHTFLVILLCWYKRYSICLISFFSLYEFFPGFICANNIGSLVNSLFGVNIFNPFLYLLLLYHIIVVACRAFFLWI